MKVLMILICIAMFTVSVFLIAKFGIKRKEGQEYVNANIPNELDDRR